MLTQYDEENVLANRQEHLVLYLREALVPNFQLASELQAEESTLSPPPHRRWLIENIIADFEGGC